MSESTATGANDVPFQLVLEQTALVIVDMQNDFVRVGAPLEVPDARDTIAAQARLAEWFRSHDRPVVYTRFISGPERTLIWNWSPQIAPPTKCCWDGHTRSYGDVDGERDAAAVIDELKPSAEDLIVDKYSYGAFHRTNLMDHLVARHVDTICVTGTVTQICVDETARGGFDHGFQVAMVSDAVSSFDDELHRATLRNFAMKFGRVLTTEEVMAELVA